MDNNNRVLSRAKMGCHDHSNNNYNQLTAVFYLKMFYIRCRLSFFYEMFMRNILSAYDPIPMAMVMLRQWRRCGSHLMQ